MSFEADTETVRYALTRFAEGYSVQIADMRPLGNARSALDRLVAEHERLREGVRKIAGQQPITLEMIRHNGFVFDDIGREPGNWKHLAFSIYVDLCEVDTIARALLDGTGTPA